ncbi:hypothetical protein BX666DRAFT_187262 [Dichotomocladium elegans]|nr:hypothetical protein BX666DRAFT_187262 [Dichotomocladium elegans]
MVYLLQLLQVVRMHMLKMVFFGCLELVSLSSSHGDTKSASTPTPCLIKSLFKYYMLLRAHSLRGLDRATQVKIPLWNVLVLNLHVSFHRLRPAVKVDYNLFWRSNLFRFMWTLAFSGKRFTMVRFEHK